MPVLDKNYLIGRVVETNYLSSRVLLLTDLNSRIPVTLGNNATQAILKGTGGNQPVLEYLPENFIIEDGLTVLHIRQGSNIYFQERQLEKQI